MLRTVIVPTKVRNSNPTRKTRKVKTERGMGSGRISITNRGLPRKSHATTPHKPRPRDAKMIIFFFVDGSMSFIHSLSVNKCITLHMLHALKGEWSLDRRGRNKKSAARRGQVALLLKLALDAPLS